MTPPDGPSPRSAGASTSTACLRAALGEVDGRHGRAQLARARLPASSAVADAAARSRPAAPGSAAVRPAPGPPGTAGWRAPRSAPPPGTPRAPRSSRPCPARSIPVRCCSTTPVAGSASARNALPPGRASAPPPRTDPSTPARRRTPPAPCATTGLSPTHGASAIAIACSRSCEPAQPTARRLDRQVAEATDLHVGPADPARQRDALLEVPAGVVDPR